MTEVALKRVASIIAGQSPPSSEVGDYGTSLPFLQGNAEFGSLSPTPRHECGAPPKRCRRGDILLSVRAPVGALNIADQSYGIGRGLCAIRPAPDLSNVRFVWWALHSQVDVLQASATGSTYSAVTADDVGGLPIPLPSLAAQRVIADFLDTETVRIDALIAKKQRLQEILAEKRQAAIDVTIDSSAPSVRVKFVSRNITSGPRGWAEHAGDQGEPFFRVTNVSGEDIELDLRDTLRVDPPWDAEARRSRVRSGDVLVSITADIGSVALVRAEHAGGYISQHVARVRPVGCVPEWLAYGLCTTKVGHQLDARQYGGTKTQLSLTDVREVLIPMPAVSDQQRRVEGLRNELGKLRQVDAALARQTNLLREHRQALITAAVTGEFEVPGVAA